MGKVLKYVGWAFLGILVLVLGTVGVLFAMGAFSDETVYLDTITFDSDTLKEGIDVSDTTLSVINDTLVATDSFSINTTFEPASATAKTLNIKILKGSDVVSVPTSIVAGEPLEITVKKVCEVNTGSKLYYLVDGYLYNSNNTPVDDSTTYELFPEIKVIRINDSYYKYIEYNVGGEVKIQATDSEGGTTYTNFDFYVDTAITGLNYDFTDVQEGGFTNNTIVFNENDMSFTLNTTPTHSINPSTGEVYGNIFSMKNITTTSSDEDVIKIKKTENLEVNSSGGDTYRYIRYTFNSLKAGTSTITSKTLPTYQMYLDYLVADNIFNTNIGPEGYNAVTDFANKYIEYLKTAGEIDPIKNESGDIIGVTTAGYEWYKTMLNSSGRLIINYPTDYAKLMDFLFVTVSQEIIVENVEITNFRITRTSMDLDLFDTVDYNGQALNRNNLIKLLGISLESSSENVSQEALNMRVDELKMYSVKQYQSFDSVEAIEGEDLFTITKLVDGIYKEVPYYTQYTSDGSTKYMTYTRNDAVLGVTNPNAENGYTWTIRANKEQEREDDGTAIVMVLYDDVSGIYFDAMTKVNIKINQINVFSLNTNLIRDMSLSTVNDHGKPNRITVDLRYENIGTANSLIKDFTQGASYTNIKLFVTATTAKLDGVLKVRVKTKDGTETGEPMTYLMPIGTSDVKVYEIDYTTSEGLICIEALNTSIKYILDGNNNPTSAYTPNTIMMYVGVVRTDVLGRPVDASGNLVDEKFAKDTGDGWEYKNQYDFIKVASESLSFNIYSYLQSVQFYTANETADGSFLNRTTVDGTLKDPVKMIVGQRFELYVTNLTLDETGTFTGKTADINNLNTAFFDFYYNNLTVQNKSASFATNNVAAEVQSSIEMIKGMLKITIECKDSTSSVDVYIAMDEEGNNFLETCTVNLQLSYATIAKVEGTVMAYYSEGPSTNQIIENNDTLTIKGVLQNSKLTWQVFDSVTQENKGEFVFGGVEEQNSLDYNISLNIDNAYATKSEAIINDIKDSATYKWTSSHPDYVEITEKADANGYDPLINICKGEAEGISVVIECQVFMYPEAEGSSDTKYIGTTFTFRFVLFIIQSDIVVDEYSIYEQDGVNYWQINNGTTTAQKITGGQSFDILKSNTAKDSVGGNDVSRNPIYASIDNIDIRSSLTFTIETYSSDNPNSHHPIYFLDADGNITYTISGLSMQDGDFSLVVYAKDTLRAINAGIKISTYYTGYADFVYHISVIPNLSENNSLPTGKSFIETTRGVGDTVYTFGVENKSLDDYYDIVRDDGQDIPLTYTILSNEAYGQISSSGNKFIPSRVAPLSATHYQDVRVLIQYTITLPDSSKEVYTYDTVSVHVLPYYNVISYTTSEFDIKSGAPTNLFTAKEYDSTSDLEITNSDTFSGNKLFNISSSYGTGAIDDMSDIIRIQLIEDSEGQLLNILGDAEYRALLANDMYLTDGNILTNPSLTTDELVKFAVYFIEGDGKYVQIGGDTDNVLYLNVKNTVRYSTNYVESTPYEVEKNYDITYSASAFDINYEDTIVTVFDGDDTAISNGTNLVSLMGGNSKSVFSQIINRVILQKYSGGSYSVMYQYELGESGGSFTRSQGTNAILGIELSENMISKVTISYNDSVNVETTYRLLFTAINGSTYQFYFKLLPNITISPFYPIEISKGYENVEYGTTVDLETNYIRKNNRVELTYNDVVLGARLSTSDASSITLSVPADTLISSGLIDKVDSSTLGSMTLDEFKASLLLLGTVPVKVNGVDSIFDYQVVSGGTYVDSGAMNGSKITFVIPEGGTAGNAVVQVRAFNGATYEYVFKVQNKITKYSVSVATPVESHVFADNDFDLDTFINSCRIDSVSDYTALRIIVVDFNTTTLRLKGDGGYSVVNPYDLITYNATFKFDDVSESKVVVFKMYTTTSVDGDAIVELKITVNPNAIISQNQSSVPAGVEIQFENTELSPFIITYGDTDLTEVPASKITYTLVDESGNDFTYDAVKSGNKITYANISEPKAIYVKIEIDLNGVVYTEIRTVTFVPNIKIVFDYESSAVASTYKNLVAASITQVGSDLSNTAALDMWDYTTNSSVNPITISDYYGNSLAADNTSASKPTIAFELTESGGIIDNVHPTQGRILYYPSNKSNVQAKVTVVITWANGAVYRKTYNIHFQPNVADTNGVVVQYSNKNGNAVDNTKTYVSIYGGSEVEILTFNTNNTTAIDSRVDANTVFMQAYKKDGVEVVNSVSINVYDAINNEKTISYIRFNSDDNNELYTIVEVSGTYYIRFEAVKQQTQVTIPYYLDLVNKNGGGVFTTEENQNYYKSLTKGEIIVNLFPVISNVSTIYTTDNPRSLIIREGDINVVNMYELLDVTLIENASFDTSATDSVIISKEYLAKLFTLTVENSYAYKDGQQIVFNLNDILVNKISLQFTIEGFAEVVTLFVNFGSKATLGTIDSVDTFTFAGENFYIIENEIYDYKLTLRGTLDGTRITIDGSYTTTQTTESGTETVEIYDVVSSSITEYKLDDGSAVLNIYSAEVGTIDLSTLVRYEVQNRKVIIGGVTYYLDEVGVGEYQLVRTDLTKYTGEYTINDSSITIQETQTITKSGESGTVEFGGDTYYLVKVNSEYNLYTDASGDSDKKVSTIDGGEFVATPKPDFNTGVVYFDKEYPIVDEAVPLNKNGLTYILGTVGENDKYVQSGSILTLIPFYSTDLASDKKPFTFDVNSNTDLSTSITFYILPIETEWEITFNGDEIDANGYIGVTAPDSGAVGSVNIEAIYRTLGGTKEASGYKYIVDGASNIVNIEEDSNVLTVNYQNFSEDITVTINVQAYFNGELVTSNWEIKIAPLRAFKVLDKVDTLDPKQSHEYLVENGSDGLVVRGSYFASDNLVFELANSADSEYVAVSTDGTTIEVFERLYLLTNREIKFNATFTTKINEVTCVFNKTVTLTLNQNTRMLGLQSTYTADSSSTSVATGTTMMTTMNVGNAFKLVDINDETNEYDELDISLSKFSHITNQGYDVNTGTVEAKIENGLINIYFTPDGNGNYPTNIDATFVINVTYGSGASAKTVYTSDTIRVIINNPVVA